MTCFVQQQAFLAPAVHKSSRCWAVLVETLGSQEAKMIKGGWATFVYSPDEQQTADEAQVHPDLGPRPVGRVIWVRV